MIYKVDLCNPIDCAFMIIAVGDGKYVKGWTTAATSLHHHYQLLISSNAILVASPTCKR